jgi:hypothetical protein
MYLHGILNQNHGILSVNIIIKMEKTPTFADALANTIQGWENVHALLAQ